ncbi:SAM-dependent methyltransferase [Pseudomarimonas arenosa]|uniref:Class I SAM-dependent methyltransferase n=1 Tax=Pseudomarimonas arenosa TaxID=2774145 RepID=A0AAW3ZN59_9GAMM|nr:cyclopropane-fatty-acyl-phospholipid synthase family protein [Pseudomarimonas arenosa]MBD8527506.1 class I SAM-dependent methyltransferase [Pseudomarimonas arenosa]
MSDAYEHSLPQQPETSAGPLGRLLRRRLLDLLAQLRGCEIELSDGEDNLTLGSIEDGQHDPIRVRVDVLNHEFYRMTAAQGSVGAAEAYMEGHWRCSDLVGLVRILVRNRHLLDAMETGTARLGGWLLNAWHGLRRNTKSGSRRNIAAHYDLGNSLFKLFLDSNMMYSSAIFANADESLETASERKLDRICQKLQLRPGLRVVEIGTGWGGFALHAAGRYGCHVTSTTISAEQHALAKQRVEAAGLQDRVTLLQDDYRDLTGRYDHLVSIEMIEAIGHQYLNTYFEKVAALLKPEGSALIQAITIEDHRYQQALTSVDFIKRFVFPGSFIPSVSAMLGAAARTDLRLFNLEDIGPSYALTLRHWRRRFMSRLSEVRELGYPDRFIRMWEFYLAYCEGGFIERSIGNVHLLFTKPGSRRGEWLPGLV